MRVGPLPLSAHVARRAGGPKLNKSLSRRISFGLWGEYTEPTPCCIYGNMRNPQLITAHGGPRLDGSATQQQCIWYGQHCTLDPPPIFTLNFGTQIHGTLYISVCLESGDGLDSWLNNCLFTLKRHSFSVRSWANAPSSSHDDVIASKQIPCKRQLIPANHEIHRINTTHHMVSESLQYMQKSRTIKYFKRTLWLLAF